MDASKRARPAVGAVILAALLAVGCSTTVPTVKTKSETEIAVSEIPADWLLGCDKISDSAPDNEVGELLLDYTELAKAYATSCTRYKNLSDYLKEVVKKERVLPANQ